MHQRQTQAEREEGDDRHCPLVALHPQHGISRLNPTRAQQIYAQSGLGPKDIDAAVIYDAFTAIVLWQLESFGFCKVGEAKDFVKNGNLEVGGRLPSNTHGGQLSEAYIHGMNGVNEGVRLIRGTSANQPKKADHVLVTAGVGVPTSAMILGKA